MAPSVTRAPTPGVLSGESCVRFLRIGEASHSLSAEGRQAPTLHLPKLRELVQYSLDVRAPPSLEGLPALEELTVYLADLKTLDGLEHGRRLRSLTLGGSKTLTDLGPLAGLTALEELSLDRFEKIEDLSPLASLRGLKHLCVDEASIHDLGPLAGLTELTHLQIPRNPLTSVEPLARLPNLEHLSVEQCFDLESIRPLASCPKLVSLDVEYCDKLRGPKNLADLRAAAKAPPRKTYPSAGVMPTRQGRVAAFDTRNHLPRHRPEGWSLPERETLDDASGTDRTSEDAYFIEGEAWVMAVKLWSRNDQYMLSVQLGSRDGRISDRHAARLLRRLRACGPFVEAESDVLRIEGFPDMRAFIAKAHAASPDTWGVIKERRPYLRIEAPDETAADQQRSAEADVRNHLPSPLPDGWAERPANNAPPDTAVVLETPYADVTVWLRREDGRDVHKLFVGLIPRPKNATLGDQPLSTSSRASEGGIRVEGADGGLRRRHSSRRRREQTRGSRGSKCRPRRHMLPLSAARTSLEHPGGSRRSRPWTCALTSSAMRLWPWATAQRSATRAPDPRMAAICARCLSSSAYV